MAKFHELDQTLKNAQLTNQLLKEARKHPRSDLPQKSLETGEKALATIREFLNKVRGKH